MEIPIKIQLSRILRISQWIIAPFTFVSGFVYLFIGCCVNNYICDAMVYPEIIGHENDSTRQKYVNRSIGAILLGGYMTILGIISLAGCFGTWAPTEI